MSIKIRKLVGATLVIVGAVLALGETSQTLETEPVLASGSGGTGGPIVLDGMDPVCHAGMGENTDGYIKKVVKSVYDRSNGPNNGRIAIIGASSSTNGPCAGTWPNMLSTKFLTEFGASSSGLQPAYDFYVTDAQVNAFFTTTISASAPRMIWIPDDWGRSASVEAILTANAEKLADFVNSGGGIFASYGSYGWLTALLPNAVFNNGGCNGGPEATADGTADFGLTNTIVAACWHGYFTGNIGTLKVLVDYPYPSPTSTRKAVSIGGGSVSLPSSFMLAVSPTNPEAGQPLTITATAQTLAGVPQAGVTVSMTVTSGPDAGQTFTATTSATGIATFTINTSSVGSNTYTATATVNGVLKTVSVTTTWAAPSTTTAAPTTTTLAPTPTTSASTSVPAPVVMLYEVALDINGGSCLIDGTQVSSTTSAVFLGYRYLPGPTECLREGFSLEGWALSSNPTVSANLPLLIDPSDGVWRYFVAADLDLIALWSEHPIPTTTSPDDAATPTTEHDHSSHDHGLPATGSNSMTVFWIGLGLAVIGAYIYSESRRKKE